jgi:hypothetical protein
MANKEKDLFKSLRASGVRKKVASALTDSASSARRRGKTPKVISDSAQRLRQAASNLERHAGASKRSDAAKKAAATRKRKAAKRSAAAKKAARTRARSG